MARLFGAVLPICWSVSRAFGSGAGAFVRRLDREFPALVTFLLVAGVEPTNNLAERSLRHGVVLRKISLGTSSEWGRRWIERALSLYQTCRLQKRSFFEVLGEALGAAWGDVAPDLGWIEARSRHNTPPPPIPRHPPRERVHMDHSMLTSFFCVDHILGDGEDKKGIWGINTEQEYHEEAKENK